MMSFMPSMSESFSTSSHRMMRSVGSHQRVSATPIRSVQASVPVRPPTVNAVVANPTNNSKINHQPTQPTQPRPSLIPRFSGNGKIVPLCQAIRLHDGQQPSRIPRLVRTADGIRFVVFEQEAPKQEAPKQSEEEEEPAVVDGCVQSPKALFRIPTFAIQSYDHVGARYLKWSQRLVALMEENQVRVAANKYATKTRVWK